MKVGDLVKIGFRSGNIVGVFMSAYKDKYGILFVIQTPDGKFVGEKHPFRLSLMEVLNEDR